MNWSEHNKEVKRVWEAYHAGKPYRIPVMLGVNPRIFLQDPKLNTEHITFQQYSENIDVMIDVQMRFQYYVRHNLYADREMGLPEQGWSVYVDLQNYFEAAWYGADIIYYEDQVPDCTIILQDDAKKNMLFHKGLPDPFGGIYTEALRKYEYIQSQIGKRFYMDVPLGSAGLPSHVIDGIFTAACNLRGTTEFCMDIYEDPDYAEELLDYVTDATIARLKAWNKRFRGTEKVPGIFFADDSIQLLSKDTYRDLVLPRHKRLLAELTTGEAPNSFHGCGDVTRHLLTIRDELHVGEFDTGFPINHGQLVKDLGPQIRVNGGPHIAVLLGGTPEAVRAETRRILEEVKPHTGRFVLRDANNLPPCTPPENVKAMYEAALEYGTF